MTSMSAKQGKTDGGWMAGYGPFAAMNSTMNMETAEAWVQGSRSLLEGALAISEELGHFTQRRLQDDMETFRGMLACGNVLDALECQRQFAQRMTAQYAEEAGKLANMMAGMANGGSPGGAAE